MNHLRPTRLTRMVGNHWSSLAEWPPLKYGRIQLADLRRPVAPAPVRPDPARWRQDRLTAA